MAEFKTILDAALALLPSNMDTPSARVHMLAFGLQESLMKHRYQVLNGRGKGPARGLWQFERGGGVLGVLQHPQSRVHARRVCDARGVEPDSRSVWERMETDDALAGAFARLLMWTDPLALPAATDAEGAWRLYLRTWRPGAYTNGSPETKQSLHNKFTKNHRAAQLEILK